MRFKSISGFLGALAVAVVALQPAQATIIEHALFGQVTSAAENNPFKLEVGDRLTGLVSYDSDLVTGVGFETLRVRDHAALQFDVHIGDFDFDETDNSRLSGPHFVFSNGRLLGIVFSATFRIPETETGEVIDLFDFSLSADFSLDGETSYPKFSFGGPGIEEVSGDFAIPEPGTLALVGVGLAGLGLARRRRGDHRAA